MEMILKSILHGALPTSILKGTIKNPEKKMINNYSSIFLLNFSYKIIAKLLQLRIWFLMLEVIHLDQTNFFLL